MTKIILDRSDHEVYFLPFGKNQPGKKRIIDYLKAHHPLYSSSCRIDSRPKRICGKNFMMITVLNDTKKVFSGRIFRPRTLTASSILASSSYAALPCTIHYCDERIVFGEHPESINVNRDFSNDAIADLSLESQEKLLSLAQKENISVSLFEAWWKYPAAIGCLLACILVYGFFSVGDAHAKTREPLPVAAETIKVSSGDYWYSFAEEIKAIYSAGGKIDEYHFSMGKIPTQEIQMRGNDPALMRSTLEKDQNFVAVTLSDMLYENGLYRFSLGYSLNAPPAYKDELPEIYSLIQKTEQFCLLHGFTLSGIIIQGNPQFNFLVTEQGLPDFPEKMKKFCDDNELAPFSLQIARNEKKENFSAELILQYRENSIGGVLPEPSVIASVFDIPKKQTPKKSITFPEKNTKIIGKIVRDSEVAIVFTKSDNGKISTGAKQ